MAIPYTTDIYHSPEQTSKTPLPAFGEEKGHGKTEASQRWSVIRQFIYDSNFFRDRCVGLMFQTPAYP
jgi:hypothetical protein